MARWTPWLRSCSRSRPPEPPRRLRGGKGWEPLPRGVVSSTGSAGWCSVFPGCSSRSPSSAAARAYYPNLIKLVHSDHLQVQATGTLAINHDFDVYLQADLHRAEFVSLPLALVLLLVVFATVVAALLPLGVGGLAVVGGLAGVGLLARVTEVSTYATNIVTLIGLGVAIDYSLFIVNRFREELNRGHSVEEALAVTMATSGRTVSFSVITVGVVLMYMLFLQV